MQPRQLRVLSVSSGEQFGDTRPQTVAPVVKAAPRRPDGNVDESRRIVAGVALEVVKDDRLAFRGWKTLDGLTHEHGQLAPFERLARIWHVRMHGRLERLSCAGLPRLTPGDALDDPTHQEANRSGSRSLDSAGRATRNPSAAASPALEKSPRTPYAAARAARQ